MTGKKFWKKRVDLFLGELGGVGSILDICSGDGRKGAQHYINSGIPAEKYYAIDGQKNLISILKSKTRVNCECVEFNKDTKISSIFNIKNFDVVIFSEAIEHFFEDQHEEILSNIVEVVSKNGTLIIAFPEYPGIESGKWGHKMLKINLKKITQFLDPFFGEREGFKLIDTNRNKGSSFAFIYRKRN